MISIKPLSLNANCPIRDNLEFVSKLTDESNLHKAKQLSYKYLTDAGILKNFNPVLENTFASIPHNFECDSNTTDSILAFS
jgi:hypothetical protein